MVNNNNTRFFKNWNIFLYEILELMFIRAGRQTRGSMSLYRSPELLASLFQRFLKTIFYYESMGANDPHGVATLDPRGMVGRIYVGDH